ncbi:tyrosine-type recombinase/integrase [Pseudomonas sp.]|uniref:tyrosine-type recombinase/integrase n=1 Tax=Pseudomonas sp. TaxID=306 RepID=UPI003F401A39
MKKPDLEANFSAKATLPLRPIDRAPRFTVEFALEAFLSRFSKKNSRATVLHGLRKAADDLGYEEVPLPFVPWDQISAPELAQLVESWRGIASSASIRVYIFAVRGVVESCVIHHLVHHDQYEPMRRVRGPKRETFSEIRQYIRERDRRRLLLSCDGDERTTLGMRDKAMLSILFGSGVRRTEATQLKIEDLDLNEGTFQTQVLGGHFTEKYLAAWAIQPLREWLAELARWNIRKGAILYHMSKGGRPLSPISPNGLWRALGERCKFAGVPIIKPNDARTTLASDLIREHGLNTAKAALGHADIATTATYDKSDNQNIKIIFNNKNI